MPVSTLPFDTTDSRRSSGNYARWSMSRDRTSQDDGRVSMDGMEGNGLYQSENWPFVSEPERNITPETVVSLQNGDGRPISAAQSPTFGRHGSENGVRRKPLDTGQETADSYEEKDVSDLEDSDEISEDDADSLYEESRRSSPVVPTKQGLRDVSSRASPEDDELYGTSRPTSVVGKEEVLAKRRDQWREHRATRSTEHHDVSPIREESQAVEGVEQMNGLPLEPEISPPQNDRSEERHDSHNDEEYERIETNIPSSPIIDGTLPSPTSNTSPSQNYGRLTPTTSPVTRQSSLMKSPPPSRNLSRRTPSISKNIPHDKSKVRYSWQSIQDEEPSRPRIHIIKLVSNTATASAGFPQGEALGFSISPQGRRLAAYNSARLYVLQTPALPVGVSQDYALKRRPLAVEINDEGNMLAILMNEDTINVYDLSQQQLRRIRTIRTDNPAHCIALAPTGGLLAAGYEGGLEVFSLAPSAMETDRRSFRTQRIDSLTFSEDGSTLLGTTTRINVSHTMVISVPLFPSAASGIPTHEELKHAWIFDVHNPENIRNSSHAVFMREKREICNERVFAWNGLEDTFGVLNIGDMQYGNVDFPVVISPPLSTCGGLGAAIHSTPAIDEHGDTVAMVVNDRTIRLYIVPHRPDDDETTVEAHSIDHELDEGYGCPFTEVRWVYNNNSLPAALDNQTNVQGRLIVTSPGGVVDPSYHEESVDDIEGGRIILFDFDPQFAGQPGQTFSLTLGQTSQPQLLEEPVVDVAEEISLVRRRTVNQSKGTALSQRPIALGRAATTFGGNRGDRSLRAGSPASVPGRNHRTSVYSIQSGPLEGNRSLPDLMETNEALDTFEEPYAQGAPRSQASLQRAASNAQRHRFQALEERTQERGSTDSGGGGFLPLPEYTEEPNAPLPSRFRAMAGLDTPAAPPTTKPAIVTNMDGNRISPASSAPSSAPPAMSENFSSEQAFRRAGSSQSRERERTNTPSSPLASSSTQQPPFTMPPRSDTFDSPAPIPRSLQRAYNNAPTAQSPVASLSGHDWENSSPVATVTPTRNFSSPSHNSTWRSQRSAGTLSPPAETLPEEEPYDAISPLPPPDHSRFARSQPSSYPNRYSTSLLNPPGHPGQSSPVRAPSAASSYATTSTSQSSNPSPRQRRLPPHIQSFQRAAAAQSNGASLFPPSERADAVPYREQPQGPVGPASSVPHPVTAWHPPAPSIVSAPPGSARGHSRKSSLSNRSAFASTEKAKNLGFFRTGTKRGRKKGQLYGPQFADLHSKNERGGNESLMETRSIFTTFTKREGKCVLM